MPAIAAFPAGFLLWSNAHIFVIRAVLRSQLAVETSPAVFGASRGFSCRKSGDKTRPTRS
jgi:hypothetical protein